METFGIRKIDEIGKITEIDKIDRIAITVSWSIKVSNEYMACFAPMYNIVQTYLEVGE